MVKKFSTLLFLLWNWNQNSFNKWILFDFFEKRAFKNKFHEVNFDWAKTIKGNKKLVSSVGHENPGSRLFLQKLWVKSQAQVRSRLFWVTSQFVWQSSNLIHWNQICNYKCNCESNRRRKIYNNLNDVKMSEKKREQTKWGIEDPCCSKIGSRSLEPKRGSNGCSGGERQNSCWIPWQYVGSVY